MKKFFFLLLSVVSLYSVAQEKAINLNVRPRVNLANFEFENSGVGYSEKMNAKTALGLGVELEFVMPRSKNKWALTLEPTYTYAKADKTSYNKAMGDDINSVVDYKALEIPLGARHYMFLNEKSKFFVDAQFSINFTMGSSLVRTYRPEQSNTLKLGSRPNALVGFGYKYNNKYGAQLRYSFAKSITGDYLNWTSNYKTLSLILSYNLL